MRTESDTISLLKSLREWEKEHPIEHPIEDYRDSLIEVRAKIDMLLWVLNVQPSDRLNLDDLLKIL